MSYCCGKCEKLYEGECRCYVDDSWVYFDEMPKNDGSKVYTLALGVGVGTGVCDRCYQRYRADLDKHYNVVDITDNVVADDGKLADARTFDTDATLNCVVWTCFVVVIIIVMLRALGYLS